MNAPINKEATYIEGGVKPVVFRKVERPDVTINIIGDYVTLEIAEEHAPKEGKPDQAYVADGRVFLWAEWKGEWVPEGVVGQVWEPVPVQVGHVPEELLQQPGIFAEPNTFTFKGEWARNAMLPEGGVQPGDCWVWNDHFWARTARGFWKDYGEVTATPMVQVKVLEDLAAVEGEIPHPVTDAFLQELYQADVRANFPGTFEEWRAKNGDLNALLKMATKKTLEGSHQQTATRDFHAIPTVDLSPAKARGEAIENKEHPSLDDVSSLLESGLAKLEGEQNDVALKALGALKKVKVDLRRKRRNAWFRRAIALLVLGAIGYGLYKWIPTQIETGRYTVPKTCSVPFGNSTIQGMRYYHYTYKSLFGIHFTLESTVREVTDVAKDGKEFTVFGLSPRNEVATEEEMALADKVLKAAEVEVEGAPKPPKGKWWRINVWSSDKGTQWMKPAELYLFASEKYTTMVAYKDFCK